MQRQDVIPEKYVKTTLLSRQFDKLKDSEIKQLARDEAYKAVKGLRASWNYKETDHDEMGLNLLHWAAYCNQLDEVKHLVKQKAAEQKSDVDSLSVQSKLPFRQMTALWLAAQNGHANMIRFLLEQRADLKAKPEQRIEGYFNDYWSTAPSALSAITHNHRDVIKALEKSFTENYIQSRNYEPEYKTETSLLGLFSKKWGFSKTEKLEAAAALQAELSEGTATQDSLSQLQIKYPALASGDLAEICNASICARRS